MQRPPFPQSESRTQSVTGEMLLQWPTQASPLSQWAYSEQTASGPPHVCDTGEQLPRDVFPLEMRLTQHSELEAQTAPAGRQHVLLW